MARHRPFDRAPGADLQDRTRQRQAQLEKRAGLTSKLSDRASRRAAEALRLVAGLGLALAGLAQLVVPALRAMLEVVT